MGEVRRARARAAAAGFVALVLLLGLPRNGSADVAPGALLVRYHAALDALPPPGDMVFTYTESRSGPTHALAEQHHVYRRADGAERNETVAVNGAQVVPAIVRFTHVPTWPYDVRRFAVDGATYDIVALGRSVVAGRHVLGLSTVKAVPGDFAITAIYLDYKRALPVRETFAVTGSSCAGTGSIDFAPQGNAWLPVSVSVRCAVPPDGATFKETISFSDYTFPATLPSDVFGGQP